jgi:hypothetical protein
MAVVRIHHLVRKFADQECYIAAVSRMEEMRNVIGDSGTALSKALQDPGRQQLATATRLYENGWYSKLRKKVPGLGSAKMQYNDPNPTNIGAHLS